MRWVCPARWLPWLSLAVLAPAALRGEDSTSITRVTDRVDQVTFSSRALEARRTFVVVLPEGYDAGQEPWPAVYLLHGKGRHALTLVDDRESLAILLGAPFVTVLPEGDQGWWIDSPQDARSRYGGCLDEVIRAAESAYRLSRNRTGRGLCGWSMGAYGAVRLAQERPEDFAAVVSIIGVLDYPGIGKGRDMEEKGEFAVFGRDPAVWEKFNPIRGAGRLRGMSILLVTADRAFDRGMNERFRAELQRLGIAHEWIMLSGFHSQAVVKAALPAAVVHLARALAPLRRISRTPDREAGLPVE